MLYLYIHFYLLLFYPQITETKHECASPTESSEGQLDLLQIKTNNRITVMQLASNIR